MLVELVVVVEIIELIELSVEVELVVFVEPSRVCHVGMLAELLNLGWSMR